MEKIDDYLTIKQRITLIKYNRNNNLPSPIFLKHLQTKLDNH